MRQLTRDKSLVPRKLKYRLLTTVGSGRRMGSRKDLAERVRFELIARLPILTGSPVASRSRSAIEPSLQLDSCAFPLVILDWDLVQIEGATLETWLPSVSPGYKEPG